MRRNNGPKIPRLNQSASAPFLDKRNNIQLSGPRPEAHRKAKLEAESKEIIIRTTQGPFSIPEPHYEKVVKALPKPEEP